VGLQSIQIIWCFEYALILFDLFSGWTRFFFCCVDLMDGSEFKIRLQ